MNQPARHYGLMIRRRNAYGTQHIDVTVVRREGDSIRGCSSDGCNSWDNDPKHLIGLQLDGLGLYGFVSDYSDCAFIGYEPEYRDVFSVDLPKLERMRRALSRVVKRQRKDSATEHGDVLVSMAKALNLTFVCHKIGPDHVAFDEASWDFMSIEAGRNYFRHVVEEVRTEVKAKKEGRAA